VTLAVSAKTSRSSYVDTLRALAIVRVYVHHTLWISWLTTLFPSMWVMFALAGLLTARSVDSRGGRDTIRARFRRTLPPLWGLAVIVVPLMLIAGWASDSTSPLRWHDLVYWIVPLANPPTSSWAGAFALGLWYLRAYLWFVLLSPMLLWAFRRWPIPTLATPLLVAMVLNLPAIPLPSDKIMDVISSTAIYGTAWMLGFAWHSGQLDRLTARACGLIAAGLAAAGLAWGLAFGSSDGWPFTNQMAEALWGTGFVLVLLRWHPSMEWLKRVPAVAKTVAYLNSRAVTIYVWHLPVLLAGGTLLGMAGVSTAGMAGRFAALTLGVALLAVTVVATGWIEDLAARRRVALPSFRRFRIPRTAPAPAAAVSASAAPTLANAVPAQSRHLPMGAPAFATPTHAASGLSAPALATAGSSPSAAARPLPAVASVAAPAASASASASASSSVPDSPARTTPGRAAPARPAPGRATPGPGAPIRPVPARTRPAPAP
jgi:peptidoglycan/LPS O-acetylase OafA/YrhL